MTGVAALEIFADHLCRSGVGRFQPYPSTATISEGSAWYGKYVPGSGHTGGAYIRLRCKIGAIFGAI